MFSLKSTMRRFRYCSNTDNLYSLLSQPKHPFHAPTFLRKSPTFLNSNQFHTKTAFNSPSSLISSLGSSSVCASPFQFSQNSQSLHLYTSFIDKGLLVNLYLLKHQYHGRFQSFSTASSDVVSSSTPLGTSSSNENCGFGNVGIEGVRPNATSKQVSEIIDMIIRGENDLESKLNSMNVSLSIASVTRIFQVLNREKVSALRFYDWIRGSQPNCCYRNEICSLVIDNCGQLDDYASMRCLLNDFQPKGICLSQKAFRFISRSSSKEATVRKVVEVLNEVGGSCRGTGVCSLIEMFSVLGSFEMAEFLMQITERKRSYYNIMIREKCRRCNFGGAMDMLDEMRQVDCDPDAYIYNYIISSLWKNNKSAEATKLLEQMVGSTCLPDGITFEIFICYSCKHGNFDFASKLLDKMELRGIKPRLTTHAAFVNGYFKAGRYEEAYKYVIDSGVKYNCSYNSVYSMLARLYLDEDNVVIAQNILTEMMNKGLKPNFSVYVRVLKRLSKEGRTGLAEDLKSRFSKV